MSAKQKAKQVVKAYEDGGSVTVTVFEAIALIKQLLEEYNEIQKS